MTAPRVPVLEVMTSKPTTAPAELPVDEAARLMGEKGIGSLVVVEGDRPVGIVTERDLVTKVLAKDASPSEVRLRDVMSAPVLSVHPHVDIEEAARMMTERGIRRLAVVEGDTLLGLVTEKDILRIWPEVLEVTREWARAGMIDAAAIVEGHCDRCGVYSTGLLPDGTRLLCPDCRAG